MEYQNLSIKNITVKFTVLQSFIAQKSHEETLDVGLEKEIIQIVLINPKITMPKIAKKLNVTTRTIERTIKTLREKGILERKGGKRFGYWVIHK